MNISPLSFLLFLLTNHTNIPRQISPARTADIITITTALFFLPLSENENQNQRTTLHKNKAKGTFFRVSYVNPNEQDEGAMYSLHVQTFEHLSAHHTKPCNQFQ